MMEQRQKKLEMMGIDKNEIEEVPLTNKPGSKISTQSSVSYPNSGSSTQPPSSQLSQTSVKDEKGNNRLVTPYKRCIETFQVHDINNFSDTIKSTSHPAETSVCLMFA